MNTHSLFLFLLPVAAIAAGPDWQLVSDGAPDHITYVDVASTKFDGATVHVSVRVKRSPQARDPGGWSKFFPGTEPGAQGLYVYSADCSRLTLRNLGGEEQDEQGKKIRLTSSDNAIQAPSGTPEGVLHRFICDLRPAWRKLFQ